MKLAINAIKNNSIGFGLLAEVITKALLKYFPALCQHDCSKRHNGPLYDTELLVYPPVVKLKPIAKKRIQYVVWDSSLLSSYQASVLSEADAIVTASQWNKKIIEDSGVTKPVYACPIGLDTKKYKYEFKPKKNPFIFGAVASLAIGGIRKHLWELIPLFQRAFPDNPNVRLILKCSKNDPVVKLNDTRIQIINAELTPSQMDKLINSFDCYVTDSWGEGWGLSLHQAIALGIPAITTCWSGESEYINNKTAFIVKHEMVPAMKPIYEGLQGKPDEEDMILKMQQVYKLTDEEKHKFTIEASFLASKYTRERMGVNLYNILKDIMV